MVESSSLSPSGGEFGPTAVQLTRVLANDPLLSKVLWTKSDRQKILKLLQEKIDGSENGISQILELFETVGPVLALFKVTFILVLKFKILFIIFIFVFKIPEIDLLLTLHKDRRKLFLNSILSGEIESHAPKAKKRRTCPQGENIFWDLIRTLFQEESPYIFSLLKTKSP